MKKTLLTLTLASLMMNLAHAELHLSPYVSTTSIHNIRQIAVSEKGELTLINQAGELWQIQEEKPQLLLNNASPNVTPEVAYGRVALADKTGNFLLWTEHQTYTSQIPIAEKATIQALAFATIAVIKKEAHYKLARIETQGKQAVIVAETQDNVLPDARPLQVDFNSDAAKQGHIAILTLPDNTTYQHAVLGDQWEAAQLQYVERHTLEPLAKPLQINGLVFEANQLTPFYQQGKTQLVTTLSGLGAGARVSLITLNNGALRIKAESQALPLNRWQSPFSFNGKLYAVQMPHLAGHLVEYQIKGKILEAQSLGKGFSNHEYGSYETDLSAKTKDFVLIPHHGYTQVSIIDKQGHLQTLEQSLPSPIKKTRGSDQRVYLLLENGQVWVVEDK